MRRKLAYLAGMALLMTVALAGCRQEPLPDTAIRFSISSAHISASTKAIADDDKPTDGTSLIYNGSVVKLYGHMTQGTTKSAVFTGTDLTCTESSGTFSWGYDPLKYWVRTAAYEFLAVSPSTADIQGNSINGLSVNYAMQKEVSSVMQRSDCDLMVASASVADAPPSNNLVPLTFDHVCAGVRFVFKDAGTTLGDYHIKSFELRGLQTENTYNVSGGAWNTLAEGANRVSSVWQWTGDRSVTGDYDYLWDTTTTSGWYFALPQKIEYTDDTSATVRATLHFTYTVGENTQVLPVTLDLSTSSVKQWELGKVYTYKIAIQANAICFDVMVSEDWIDETEHEYEPVG